MRCCKFNIHLLIDHCSTPKLTRTQADYPDLTGSIALISRGSCTFASKTILAKTSGAVGPIIYNNVPGVVQGTLGEEGDYVPTIGLSQEDGLVLIAAIATTLTGTLVVDLASILT